MTLLSNLKMVKLKNRSQGKDKMKWLTKLFMFALVVNSVLGGSPSEILPGNYQNELKKIRSSDGNSLAILCHKEKRGLALPPEPAKTLERWVQLKVIKDGKTLI